MTNKKQHKNGFSLLELLVVISIMGILIAMGTAAFSTAQKKSRDARRRSDIKAMQDGFEQYNADNAGAYSTCNTMFADSEIFPAGQPRDPKSTAPYIYACNAPSGTYSYCVCARLESGGGNATSNTCSGLGSTNGDYYCLVNLQ